MYSFLLPRRQRIKVRESTFLGAKEFPLKLPQLMKLVNYGKIKNNNNNNNNNRLYITKERTDMTGFSASKN